MNIYRQLAEGGGFNLPYLVHLFNEDKTKDIYLINDNKDLVHDGKTYIASNFSYTPATDGSATFNIAISDHDRIINLLEDEYFFNVEVIGLFNGEEVKEIGQFKHKFGDGSWDGVKLEMKLNKDDRGDMTFPALIFNSYNNRGNT